MNGAPSDNVNSENVRLLLTRFGEVQNKRMKYYSRLHEGFREFLRTKDEAPYVTLMAETTAVFQNLSAEVISIENSLRAISSAIDCADLLRVVQEGEKEKLRLTVSLQALRKVYEFGGFDWQRTDDYPYSEFFDSYQVDEDVATRIARINLAGAVSNIDVATTKLTETEYKLAVGEATKLLEKVVNDINEALEELRYTLADLGGKNL